MVKKKKKTKGIHFEVSHELFDKFDKYCKKYGFNKQGLLKKMISDIVKKKK